MARYLHILTGHAARFSLAALVLGAVAAGAQPMPEVSGQLDFGIRTQVEEGRYSGQGGADSLFFLGLDLDAAVRLGEGDLTFRFRALQDSGGGRDVFNVQAAHYSRAFGNWDLLAGIDIRNWGVAESRSVLNLLNPRDAADLIHGGALIGTPMLNANVSTALGTFSGYALLGFVPPNLPGGAARWRAPWPGAPDRAIFQEGKGRHADFALRWSHNVPIGGGGLDLSASYFDGTSRSPVSLPGCAAPTGPVSDAACDAINAAIADLYAARDPGGDSDLYAVLDGLPEATRDRLLSALSGLPGVGMVPYYPHIRQAGFSAVFARGDVQLRAEAAFTRPKGRDAHWSGVVGGDYSFHGIGPAGGTLTLVAEYLWDDRNDVGVIFGNDAFLGLDLILNDRRDTRLRLGGFYDLDSHAQLYQLSASTRIDDSVRLELTTMQVRTGAGTDPLTFIDRDSFWQLKISTYF